MKWVALIFTKVVDGMWYAIAAGASVRPPIVNDSGKVIGYVGKSGKNGSRKTLPKVSLSNPSPHGFRINQPQTMLISAAQRGRRFRESRFPDARSPDTLDSRS